MSADWHEEVVIERSNRGGGGGGDGNVRVHLCPGSFLEWQKNDFNVKRRNSHGHVGSKYTLEVDEERGE